MSRIVQIIPVNTLLAVVKLKSGHWTYPVICIELVEDSQQNEHENHEITRRERAVITWKGRLTNTDEVPDFLGLASNQTEADCIGYRAMSEKEFAVLCEESRQGKRSFDWSLARRARSDEQMITQVTN